MDGGSIADAKHHECVVIVGEFQPFAKQAAADPNAGPSVDLPAKLANGCVRIDRQARAKTRRHVYIHMDGQRRAPIGPARSGTGMRRHHGRHDLIVNPRVARV